MHASTFIFYILLTLTMEKQEINKKRLIQQLLLLYFTFIFINYIVIRLLLLLTQYSLIKQPSALKIILIQCMKIQYELISVNILKLFPHLRHSVCG